jgi:hypothetical protein
MFLAVNLDVLRAVNEGLTPNSDQNLFQFGHGCGGYGNPIFLLKRSTNKSNYSTRFRLKSAVRCPGRQKRGGARCCALAFTLAQRKHLAMDAIFQPAQLVRVNLAGLDAGGVTFQAAVTDAVGHILKQTSEQPPK